jgi:hypothetical protein
MPLDAGGGDGMGGVDRATLLLLAGLLLSPFY